MGLTKEQQYKLINRYQSGDKDAIKEIIAANFDANYKIHPSFLNRKYQDICFLLITMIDQLSMRYYD